MFLPTVAVVLALAMTPHELMVRQLAPVFDVPPDYAACVVRLESAWDPAAVGDEGAAVGLWQWHLGSWEYVRGQMGLPTDDQRENPVQSTVTAFHAIGRMDLAHWWTADKHCQHLRD